MTVTLEASCAVTPHVNRVPFRGVLTVLGAVSDRAPSGSRGHRVVFTEGAAREALPSLLGMGLNYKAEWNGHDTRQKCGVITSAEISGGCVEVQGYLYGKDYPEVVQEVIAAAGGRAGGRRLGMSYELADAHIEDMAAEVWTITKATFAGAAVLRRNLAAYRDTSFEVRDPLVDYRLELKVCGCGTLLLRRRVGGAPKCGACVAAARADEEETCSK